MTPSRLPPMPAMLMVLALTACTPLGLQAHRPGTAAAAVARAQHAVASQPESPAILAALAQAQLKEGRFAAAADSFAQARTMGDDTPRTLLGHALALAGSWRQAEAAELLVAHGDALPVRDRGLALALAGEPDIATRLLMLAVEDDPESGALRQNLAFAFAMTGRWAEARALAARDVPPDRLPERMEQWARIASAGATPRRMALMLDIEPQPAPKPRRAYAWRRPHWAGARW